ncbi:MAG: hypothetical protein ABI600_03685 [Luteolibacter sp.]
MRVPIPVVIFLIISVMGGVWWHGTRQKDFLTPPSLEKLAEVRTRVESSFPQTDKVVDAISEPVIAEKPVVVEPPKPEIDLGDLAATPTLAQYGERAFQGAPQLIELAAALEAKGQFQRALLAWERVLDLAKPDANQASAAISAIKRLRPTLPDWNTDPAKAIPITLHAGTGSKMAKALTPVLQQAARDLERASAGMVKVIPEVTAGKSSLPAKGPTPVALWLAGPLKKSISTEVMSFTVEAADSSHQDMMKTIFELVRNFLGQSTSYTPPIALADQDNPQDALNFRITRLCWNEFATSLNLPPKKEEKPVKKP